MPKIKTHSGASKRFKVTKNGKVIGHVVPAQTEKVAAAKALIGLLPKGIDLEKEREERLNADRR